MPEYELREAAAFGHFSWTEFRALPVAEQAKVVAHKRVTRLIEQHYSADASFSGT